MILSMADKLCSLPVTLPAALPSSKSGVAAANLAVQPTLQEIFATPSDASAIGLTLAQLEQSERGPKTSPLLWIQDRKAIREAGRVFLHGVQYNSGSGQSHSILHVVAKDGREVLWAMAEGLKCSALGGVIGEVYGDPRALDFTATRRLAVAAERYGVPAFLIRINGHADLSGARRRWRVKSRPSLPHLHDPKAPGTPAWSLNLFRARDMQPRLWEAAYDRAAHSIDLVPAAADGSLEETQRKAG